MTLSASPLDPPAPERSLDLLRGQLLAHPIYTAVASEADLRTFMRAHVFAVWDFMSLAKRLQRDLTCVELPWFPVRSARSARFINEIVLAEESDLDLDGGAASHLELYLAAMDEIGAPSGTFRSFLETAREPGALETTLDRAEIPVHVRGFVRTTLNLALRGRSWEVAAAFLHGREDLIPEMFERLLTGPFLQTSPSRRLRHYLERHIELDGTDHGPAARRLLEELVEGDPVRARQALAAAERSIVARIDLWNGVLDELRRRTPSAPGAEHGPDHPGQAPTPEDESRVPAS